MVVGTRQAVRPARAENKYILETLKSKSVTFLASGGVHVTEDQTAYYRRRAAEELAAAERSPCRQAIEAHREMHRLYKAMIEQESGKVAADKPAGAEAAVG